MVINKYEKEFNSVTDEERNKCAELWTECTPQLRKLCYSKMKGYTNDVEDLIADAYVALCNYVNENGFPDNTVGWIYGTVFNMINSRFRGKYKDEKHLFISDTELIELPYKHDFVDDVINNDVINSLNELIPTLDGKEQEIVHSYYFDGRSMKDIAELLDSTIGAVKQKRYRIVNKLRDELKIKRIK